MSRIGKDDGRRVFGLDATAYEAGRPGHAGEVYEVLCERCGLRPGAKVLEVGPGTGQATRRLLELGARPLVGIEPDSVLAEHLRESLADRVEIRESSLEDAELEDDFDLAAAASSFHWVDEVLGLAKIHRALRPAGWIALWWTAFGDGNRADPFRDATDPLLRERDLLGGPSTATGGRPFAHDAENRIAGLGRAGFVDVLPRRIEWWHTWDTAGIRALFGSFSTVNALEPAQREAFLDTIAEIAEHDFGGLVTKPVVTALYTARRHS